MDSAADHSRTYAKGKEGIRFEELRHKCRDNRLKRLKVFVTCRRVNFRVNFKVNFKQWSFPRAHWKHPKSMRSRDDKNYEHTMSAMLWTHRPKSITKCCSIGYMFHKQTLDSLDSWSVTGYIKAYIWQPNSLNVDVCRSIASLYPISFPWLPESTQNSAQTLLPDFVVSKLRSAHMHILHLCILGCYFNTCGTPILCIIGACMRVYIFAYKFVCVWQWPAYACVLGMACWASLLLLFGLLLLLWCRPFSPILRKEAMWIMWILLHRSLVFFLFQEPSNLILTINVFSDFGSLSFFCSLLSCQA